MCLAIFGCLLMSGQMSALFAVCIVRYIHLPLPFFFKGHLQLWFFHAPNPRQLIKRSRLPFLGPLRLNPPKSLSFESRYWECLRQRAQTSIIPQLDGATCKRCWVKPTRRICKDSYTFIWEPDHLQYCYNIVRLQWQWTTNNANEQKRQQCQNHIFTL